jgi:ubiquinone/menaquinone biosynthesis C-methylase UbiE
MGFHTFDPERADRLEDDARFRFCSREELLALLGAHPGMRLMDLGAGTGFYTRELAPHVGRLLAVDVQPAMLDAFEADPRAAVDLLVADADTLPVADDALDAVVSTMTFHEFAGPSSLAELARTLRPGGRVVTVDWSGTGDGDAGPPRAERYDLGEAVAQLTDAGFTVERATERVETFVCVARASATHD